jgi:hypothetical protein
LARGLLRPRGKGPEGARMWMSPATAAATWLAATPIQRLGFALFFLGAALVLLSLVLRLARRPAGRG